MGGDNAPLEILKGTSLAQKEYGIAPVLVGNDKEIQKCIKDNNIALENVKIVNSNSVITMHDDAKAVLKEKADSSMGIGFKLLNEGELQPQMFYYGQVRSRRRERNLHFHRGFAELFPAKLFYNP